jgi:anthranilate/para-aminobenzoate synthase component II
MNPNNLIFVDVSHRWMSCAEAFTSNPLQVYNIMEAEDVNSIIKDKSTAKVLFFGGGGDINPQLYGHTNVASYCSRDISFRDRFEMEIAEYASQNGIPMVGVCRGAQLLTALAGGYLIQDVDGHAGRRHLIKDVILNTIVSTTSAHHQMCYPYSVPNAKIWATSYPDNIATRYKLDGSLDTTIFKEPETFEYPSIKALCFQGHPEFVGVDDQYQIYARKALAHFLAKING